MSRNVCFVFICILFTTHLHADNFDKIIKEYTFVGDFSEKAYEPEISEEVFWRYPFGMPIVTFPISFDITDLDKEFPLTKGEGRSFEHMNQGRVEFFSGNYEEAKKIWLSGRAKFRLDFPYMRRLEYYIGMAYLKMAEEKLKKNQFDYSDVNIKATLKNAATFLSWSMIVKKAQEDSLFESVTPKGLYNLAAIYYTYERFSGAFGAAQEGLDFLNLKKKKEFRPWFYRILAESYVKNRTYLEAVQEFDTAIRQDPDPNHATAIFARVGDIYFDLNNYVLADDAYDLAQKVDQGRKHFNPMQLILRGESLFWDKRFLESQKQLKFALEESQLRGIVLSKKDASFAKLRIADAFLAMAAVAKSKEDKKAYLEKANLSYFQVDNDYKNTLASKIANIRNACLELPFYDDTKGGKNVSHARELLEASKAQDLPTPLIEIAWACHVGSYAQRERNEDMLQRVRTFLTQYPTSKFLNSLVEPVRQTQAAKINDLFTTDRYKAVEFYEKNQKNLFPKLPEYLKEKLFDAYVDTFQSKKAIPFWSEKFQQTEVDRSLLRIASFLSEVSDAKKNSSFRTKNAQLAKRLNDRTLQKKWSSQTSGSRDNDLQKYIWRIQQSQNGVVHESWIYQLAKKWSRNDKDDSCDILLPFLVKLYKNPQSWAPRKMVEKDLNEAMIKIFPAILDSKDDSNESCAQSYLDFEMNVFKGRPDELAARYLKRSEWLSSRIMASLMWTVAEDFASRPEKEGNKKISDGLLKMIVDKSPPDSVEVKFAKARLDPRKTEVENLWE